MTAKFQLVVEQGPRRGQVFPLENSIITIGRDPLLDVALADPEVSRQHARMARDENGDYKIQDLGSTNGTFVNGQRLGGEPYTLSAGQEIILGSSVILSYVLATEDVDLPETATPPEGETAVSEQPVFSAADPEDTPSEPADPTYLGDTGGLQEPPPQTNRFSAPADLPPVPEPTLSPVEPMRPPVDSAPFVPAGTSERDKKRKKTVTWVLVTVVLLMLCCCGFLLSAWFWWGDPLMEALGVY